ncbi:MAG: hypothetical protein ACOCQD_00070 [archaeon]
MATFSSLERIAYIKRRPGTYTAPVTYTDENGNEVNEEMIVGGNNGFVLSGYPSFKKLTSQQKKVKDIAHQCGIKPGIDKAKLRGKMIECVGPKMRK